MKKIVLIMLNIIVLTSLIIGCDTLESTNSISQKDIVIQPKEPVISLEQTIGADMAQLDYASDDIIIFHGYFGLFICNVKESKIVRSVDLKAINCSSTQGDNYCEVSVNMDGSIIQLHDVSSKEMYIYSVVDNSLVKTSYKPMEKPFKLIPTSQAVKENAYIYSAESVKFDNGDLGYLVCENFILGTLKYIRNDKAYSIFRFSLIIFSTSFKYPLRTSSDT